MSGKECLTLTSASHVFWNYVIISAQIWKTKCLNSFLLFGWRLKVKHDETTARKTSSELFFCFFSVVFKWLLGLPALWSGLICGLCSLAGSQEPSLSFGELGRVLGVSLRFYELLQWRQQFTSSPLPLLEICTSPVVRYGLYTRQKNGTCRGCSGLPKCVAGCNPRCLPCFAFPVVHRASTWHLFHCIGVMLQYFQQLLGTSNPYIES